MPTACPQAPARPYTAMTMSAGTIKRIHVNQHLIRASIRDKIDAPSVTVQWKGKSYVGRDVVIKGESTVKQRMNKPLSCGARIWVETRAEVEIL